MTIQEKIESLKQLRVNLAKSVQELADRELGARLMRVEIEADLRQRMSNSAAEKEARSAAKYVDYERETLRLRYLHDIVLAQCEATRFEIQAALVGALATDDV